MTGNLQTMSIVSRCRSALRQARRVTRGARGLGPSVTASWAWSQRPGQSADEGPIENSSFTWVMAADDLTTSVLVHNYWSDAYGIDNPSFSASLLDLAGTVIASWTFDLEADATVTIDVRSVCADNGVALPFEGQLLLRHHHDKLAPSRPIQHYADYVHDDGESSGVHGQYGFQDRPLAQGVGSMRVESGDGRRTAIVVHNAYVGPGSPSRMRAEVEVFAHDGRHRRVAIDALDAGASCTVWLDEVFAGLEEFLGGRPGHVLVDLPCPSSRIFTYITFPPDDRLVVNHGTVDRRVQQDSGIPARWSPSRPVLSLFARCDEHHDTVIGLPNLWGPTRSAYDAQLDVYQSDGALVTTERHRVPVGGFFERRLSEVLEHAGVAGEFLGSVEVRLLAPSGVDEMPLVFDGLVALLRDGALSGEVQVGSDFYNAAVPETSRMPDIRRTRIFGRVATGSGRRTWIHLAYPVGQDAKLEPSATLLTLLDLDGRQVGTKEIALAPHGSVSASLDDLFPDAEAELAPSGVGVLRVRDTTARVFGFAAREVDGAQTVAIDHLTGG